MVNENSMRLFVVCLDFIKLGAVSSSPLAFYIFRYLMITVGYNNTDGVGKLSAK